MSFSFICFSALGYPTVSNCNKTLYNNGYEVKKKKPLFEHYIQWEKWSFDKGKIAIVSLNLGKSQL
jgi:hypothetical protein